MLALSHRTCAGLVNRAMYVLRVRLASSYRLCLCTFRHEDEFDHSGQTQLLASPMTSNIGLSFFLNVEAPGTSSNQSSVMKGAVLDSTAQGTHGNEG